MTVFAPNPKTFLLAVNGDLINVDYVRRIYSNGTGVLADMDGGPPIVLAVSPAKLDDLRHSLPLNRVVA